MRFITITLIVHAPAPRTGAPKSTRDRFQEVLDSALLAEELGFDGFGVGERHERPFISSSPTVVLSQIPDPPWGWCGGPPGDDTVPASAPAPDQANPASALPGVSPVATTG